MACQKTHSNARRGRRHVPSLVACRDPASRLVPNQGKQRQKYGKTTRAKAKTKTKTKLQPTTTRGICTIIRGEGKSRGHHQTKDVMRWVVGFAPRGNISQSQGISDGCSVRLDCETGLLQRHVVSRREEG
ncbi:hypothetical protein CP532_3709 [Ophiocordyceps camponoti-leonardi (nom. inval.)]|nr:hypothetical protein CP532_3709 [Ophiocordyceps camponoti-leonardi (nom. inval.)]